MKHDDLILVAKRWLLKPWRNASSHGHGGCSVVITDMTSSAWETPDAIGWHSGGSTLVECKVSRSDFMADKKKFVRINQKAGMGVQRFFMVPKGLVKVDEVPEGWGLIEVTPKGKTRVVMASKSFDCSHRGETWMLLSLLCRLKVDPGRHVKIRTYNMDNGSEPRATVTFNTTTEGKP